MKTRIAFMLEVDNGEPSYSDARIGFESKSEVEIDLSFLRNIIIRESAVSMIVNEFQERLGATLCQFERAAAEPKEPKGAAHVQ